MAQTLTDPIQKVVENPTDITAWILISIAIIISSFQVWQNIKIEKTVEKFKDDLAKSQYKFTRHTEMQIECLKNFYDQLVTFHFVFIDLIEPEFKTHRSLKSNILTFQDTFLNEVMTYSHRNKILLTDEIINQVRILHLKFKKIETLCRSEFDSLIRLEDYDRTDVPEYLYKTPKDEVEKIQLAINRIKQNPDTKSFEGDINTLRGLIETYFKKLVG